MPDLFTHSPVIHVELTMTDSLGSYVSRSRALVCGRCGVLVWGVAQHAAWHGAVDTNTTTQLPGGGSDA